MDDWNEIGNELMRMRQAWSCPRDLRKLGPGNFELRPILANVLTRYTRGRCLDFAVRLAEANSTLRLCGFYSGDALVHAFVMDGLDCIEVSGVWSLAEMKKLHANDGAFKLSHPPLDEVLQDIRSDEDRGEVFDSSDVVFSVAGCLPHLHAYIPDEFVVESSESALFKLSVLAEGNYSVLEGCSPLKR